jgi:hypothetical protein
VIFSFDGDRISEAPWRDFRLLAAFAVAVCLTGIVLGNRLAGRRRAAEMQLAGSAGVRMMLWTALLGYVGWLVLFSIYRYAVALEMLAPLLLCIMLTALMGTRIGVAATVGGCLFLVAATQKADFARKDWGDEPFVGAEVPAAYQGLRDAVILMAGRSADAHFSSRPSIPRTASSVSTASTMYIGSMILSPGRPPPSWRAIPGRCWPCSAATCAGAGPKTPSAPSALPSRMRPAPRWNRTRPSQLFCAG